MKFVETIENLQKKYEGTVILAKNGIFFVAIGKDAIFLSEKIGLKRTCMKDKLCKVGFLVKSADRYIERLKNENISFALYVIDKTSNSPEQLYSYSGEAHREVRNCLECANCGNKKDSEEDILNKIRNMK